MLGTIMEVRVILSYPPQLQEEHKEPYVLYQDSNRIQQSFENKSCSKWPKNMLGTIMEVKVILSYPPQLQKEHKDPYVLDQDSNMFLGHLEQHFVFKTLLYSWSRT